MMTDKVEAEAIELEWDAIHCDQLARAWSTGYAEAARLRRHARMLRWEAEQIRQSKAA